MADFKGSCLCGRVRFQVAGHFDSFYLCHCRYCRKDTGSAHAANLFSQSARLTWLSGADAVASFTLPGTRHQKSFCQTCGSALPNDQDTDGLVVPAGCLDTGIPMQPTAHIFTASQASWDKQLDQAPKFARLPE